VAQSFWQVFGVNYFGTSAPCRQKWTLFDK